MEDFKFLDVNVDDAVELQVVQNGWEGELLIAAVEPNAEKSYILIKLDIVGEELTKNIRHFLFFPKAEDDKEKINNKKLMLKSFFEAFDINGDDRKDPASWVGLSAQATTKLKNDEQYGDQNEVSRWMKR